MVRTEFDLTRRVKHDERLLPLRPFEPHLAQRLLELFLQPFHVRLEVFEAVEHPAVWSQFVCFHGVGQRDEGRDGEG